MTKNKQATGTPNCQMMDVGFWRVRVDVPGLLSHKNYEMFIKRCEKDRKQKNGASCGSFLMICSRMLAYSKVVRVSWNYTDTNGGIVIWESQYFPE